MEAFCELVLKGGQQAKQLLKTATKEQVLILVQMVQDIYYYKTPLSPHDKRKLRRKKKFSTKLLCLKEQSVER